MKFGIAKLSKTFYKNTKKKKKLNEQKNKKTKNKAQSRT